MVGDIVGDGPYKRLGVKVWFGIELLGLLGRDVGKLANDAIRTQSRR